MFKQILFILCFSLVIVAQIKFSDNKKSEVKVKEIFRIGGDSEDMEKGLVGPSGFCLDSKENIYVLDSRDFCIKKYDINGKFIKKFSRKGSGPGEISRAYKIECDDQDNIIIQDGSTKRFTFFDTEGKYLKSINYSGIAWRFQTSKNDFYIEEHDIDFSGDKASVYKIFKYNSNLQNPVLIDSVSIKDNNYIKEPMFTNLPIPFCPTYNWSFSKDGNLIVANSGDFSIKVFSSDGKFKSKIVNKAEKKKVTEKDKKTFFDGIVFSAGDNKTQGAPDFMVKGTKFPEFKNYFTSLITEPGGYLLLNTYESTNKEQICFLLDKTGKLLNKVKIAVPPGLMFFSKNNLYVFTNDENEFPVIIKYKMI